MSQSLAAASLPSSRGCNNRKALPAHTDPPLPDYDMWSKKSTNRNGWQTTVAEGEDRLAECSILYQRPTMAVDLLSKRPRPEMSRSQ